LLATADIAADVAATVEDEEEEVEEEAAEIVKMCPSANSSELPNPQT
jgi:hypothetical protein